MIGKFIHAQQQYWKRLRVKRRTIPVAIKIYQLDFVRHDEKNLLHYLADGDDLEVFKEPFIIDFIDGRNLRHQLALLGLLPYVIYTIATLFFYIKMVAQSANTTWIVTIISVTLVWLIALELRQIAENSVAYIQDPWNWLMCGSFVLSIMTIYFEVN